MHFSDGTEGVKVVIFHGVLTWVYLFIKGLNHEQTVDRIGKYPLLLCKSFSVSASSHLWDLGCIFSSETHGILEDDI